MLNYINFNCLIVYSALEQFTIGKFLDAGPRLPFDVPRMHCCGASPPGVTTRLSIWSLQERWRRTLAGSGERALMATGEEGLRTIPLWLALQPTVTIATAAPYTTPPVTIATEAAYTTLLIAIATGSLCSHATGCHSDSGALHNATSQHQQQRSPTPCYSDR